MDAAILEYQRLITRPSTPLPKQSLGRPADGASGCPTDDAGCPADGAAFCGSGSGSGSESQPDPNTIPQDRLPDLINELLEYWAEPTFDELAICRALGLTLTQVEHLAANPRFRAALDTIDRLRAQRQPALDRRRADIAESALTTVAASPPTTAAATREKRLAANTLRTNKSSPVADGGGGTRSVTEGGVSAQSPTQNKTTAPGCHGLSRKPCPSETQENPTHTKEPRASARAVEQRSIRANPTHRTTSAPARSPPAAA